MNNVEHFVSEFASGWADLDVDRLGALMDPEVCSFYAGMQEPADLAGVKDYLRTIIGLVPDIKLKPVRWATVEDVVFIEWSAEATAGGQIFNFEGTDRFKLKNGRIIEGRAYFDTAPFLKAFKVTDASELSS